MKSKSIKELLIALSKLLLLSFGVIMVTFPIIILILTSLKPYYSIGSWGDSINWTTENYQMIFSSYFLSLSLNMIILMFSIFFTSLVTIPAAFASSQLKYRFKKLLTSFIIVATIIPNSLFLSGQYRLINQLGWINNTSTLYAIVLPSSFSVLTFFLLKSGYDNLDKNIIKVSASDSLNVMDYFVKSTREIKKELYLAVFIISMSVWNQYMWPRLLLMGSDYRTLTMWIFDVSVDFNDVIHTQTQAAASILASIPPLIIFAVFHKQIFGSMKFISKI